GRFRKDLYYRLKVVTIQVPPLRERLDDVAELAHYFLFRFNHELKRDLRGFAPEALELLQGYPWPGNVRELQSTIKEAMLNASGHLLLAEFLHASLRCPSAETPGPKASEGFELIGLIESLLAQGETDLHGKIVESVERVLFARVLRQTRGHQAQASELLGISRATLRARLKALGLGVDRVLTENSLQPGIGDEPAEDGTS
ncbi:MAG: sigma-54-dependent Fis family transcriptional regulator, partial [Gemmataceae bacterium]|nr:sigma-54-dependent Fis family transcriptional regulator [Gemmataceae bacterium]